MKRAKDYIPKYSLSVKYLKKIMTTREYNDMLKKYVKVKMDNWGSYNK